MTKFEQILGNRQFWEQGINAQLKTGIYNTYENYNFTDYYSCQSRTLSNVLRNTIASYGSSVQPYKIMAGLCTLITGKSVKFHTKYGTISSEQAETLSINDLTTTMHTTDSYFNIFLNHVPKGKSYVKKVLDENEGLTRLKQIETFCIEDTQHFVRVYKGFPNTNPHDITIFSDRYTEHMIYTIFVMLPNLMDINQIDPATNEKEANRIALTRKVFQELYEIYQNADIIPYSTAEYANIQTRIYQYTTELSAQYDFVTTQLNTFTQNLAKARNANANRYFTNELNNITQNIDRLEQQLREAYIKQHNIQRDIVARKTLSDDDVKPFIDTILNTKAIEVLSTTPNIMTLRVTAPLQYFIESDFEAYERNNSSTYSSTFRNDPITKAILHKIFITREYQMLFQANIRITINDSYYDTPVTLEALRNAPFTQFPNPHLYHHNCWAKARTEINKYICAGEFELAIMQMVAAVQTMNVAENASFVNGFLNDIKNNSTLRGLCTFITKDGQTLSFEQILTHERQLQETEIKAKVAEALAAAPKDAYTQVELPDNDEDWEEMEDDEDEND